MAALQLEHSEAAEMSISAANVPIGGIARGDAAIDDMRHTHATLLLESGVDITVVSNRLGHASVETTADLYVHVTERLRSDSTPTLRGSFRNPLAIDRSGAGAEAE